MKSICQAQNITVMEENWTVTQPLGRRRNLRKEAAIGAYTDRNDSHIEKQTEIKRGRVCLSRKVWCTSRFQGLSVLFSIGPISYVLFPNGPTSYWSYQILLHISTIISTDPLSLCSYILHKGPTIHLFFLLEFQLVLLQSILLSVGPTSYWSHYPFILLPIGLTTDWPYIVLVL